MQLGSGLNQLSFQQGSAINNSQFDQKIEGKKYSLFIADKSQSCSPVKNQKKKEKQDEKIELSYADENTLNAICNNLKMFYELEIEQNTINFNQQIMTLKESLQGKNTQEQNMISEVKRIQSKYDQLQIEYEMAVRDLNHKYKYQIQLFKCQVEQQMNEYSSQLVDVMSKNTELLDILSADYSVCQQYKSLFKDYKNGQAYQELMTNNINLTNEVRMMKMEMQILQQDNTNYIQQLTKLTKKVNLFQKLNEERQQELLEKDQIIQLYQKQNEQLQVNYQGMMQDFSSQVLTLLKSKDIIQEEIVQKMQRDLSELDRQKKEFIKNEANADNSLSLLNKRIKEQEQEKLILSQKITHLEQRIKHLAELNIQEVDTMRNDITKLLKLHEKNSVSKSEQNNSNIAAQKQFYEKQITDWKNNYYKLSQKICDLEQNITSGPKFYLQKAYEDYQQNVQRTIEANENKIQEVIQHNLKLQNNLNLSSNENTILKEQIIELKDSSSNYLASFHNSQREQLQIQDKMQQINLIYEQNCKELMDVKQAFQREQETKAQIEREQQESQSRLEQQIQNLKREMISLTQASNPMKQLGQFNNQINTSLKVEKISTSTTNKFSHSNQFISHSPAAAGQMNKTNSNNSIFNQTTFDLASESAQQGGSDSMFLQLTTAQKSPMQNKLVKQQQQVNMNQKGSANNNSSYDQWQMQQFCFKMIGDFQIKFEQTMTTIKDNMDKQYHNALFKEIRLCIEKDSRVLDLPLEDKIDFTLKATDYFGLILQGRMKELKIDTLIQEIATLMKIELKEKVNLQIQLEKALKENISLQKAIQNRIGNESEDFKNLMQNQINKLFQNLKDLDTQKLKQIEFKQIEQQIKKDLTQEFELKLNIELEEQRRFVEGMKDEYQNTLKLQDQRVRDLTINLGAEIGFLQDQLEKKITSAIKFNSTGTIEDGNFHLFPQTSALKQEEQSPKQRLLSLSTYQNFQKSSSCSFNKENFLSNESNKRYNTINQTMSVMNSSIPYQILIQASNSQDNTQSASKSRQSQRFGGRQLTVSQHLSATGEISTLPSTKQHIIKKSQLSSSVEHAGTDASTFSPSSISNLKNTFAFVKPSISSSIEVNKEIVHPQSVQSDVYHKKSNRTKYLNQSIDILEGIREEKQNRLSEYLNDDLLELSSQGKHKTFNDSELRRTYQHLVLPSSKSVEPGTNRLTSYNMLGTKKNMLNTTISVLKDLQSSSKSNGKRVFAGSKNSIQGQPPNIQLNNANNKGQVWQNLKHFNQQSNQNRQKMKLSQLALITNDTINLQMQSSTSNQTYNNPLLTSQSKPQ